MKNIPFLLLLIFLSSLCRAGNTLVSDTVPKKATVSSSRKEKLYCSDFAKTRYSILITGPKIKITRLYKEFTDSYTGVLKNGKIYSNNPDEKNIKGLQGKYYKLEGKNFGVLNIENGDYEWFLECKH